MINKYDTKEIAQYVANVLRTKMQHRSVDMSGQDYDVAMNFIISIVSKYEDNSNVLNKQLNPHTGVAETAEINTDEPKQSN